MEKQDENCPLCDKRVSNWEIAGGKVVIIDGKILHRACVMDNKDSLAELAKKVKNA
jgi:hypothetical protein